jgi:hypothetical protein
MRNVGVFDANTLQFLGGVYVHNSATDTHLSDLIYDLWRNCDHEEIFFETREGNKVFVYPMNEKET